VGQHCRLPTGKSQKPMQGVTTTIGVIAVGLSNQINCCRFARKPGDQVFGQWFTMILLGSIIPLFGCLNSSVMKTTYGEAIWNPLGLQALLDNHLYSVI
jgi:NCS1 family nucleobase:cation symporter-1